MNIFLVMSLLVIVCVPFIFSNVDYSTAFLLRVVFLASNNVPESLVIPAAFGETTNEIQIQKQNIKGITNDNSNNNSIIGVTSGSNNNAVDKKEGSNQNWNINITSVRGELEHLHGGLLLVW